MYDPQIGRWHASDPLAERQNGFSPYHYCYGNPVVFTDPSGLKPYNPVAHGWWDYNGQLPVGIGASGGSFFGGLTAPGAGVGYGSSGGFDPSGAGIYASVDLNASGN